MKFLKLIIFVALLGGALFAAIRFGGKLNNNSGDSGQGITPYSREPEKFIEECEKHWYDAGKWDENIYSSQMAHASDIYQLDSQMDEESYNDMLVHIKSLAAARLITLLKDDYRQLAVNEKAVENNLNGLKALGEDARGRQGMKVNHTECADSLDEAYKAYKSIKSFATKQYTGSFFATGFKTDGRPHWSDFNRHLERECNARDTCLRNVYYQQYFYNDTMLSSRLRTVEQRVRSVRDDYYARIVNEIRNNFSKRSPVDAERQRQLVNAYKDKESASDSTRVKAINAIKAFDKAYEDKEKARERELVVICGEFKQQSANSSQKDEVEAIYNSYIVKEIPKTQY